MSKQVESQETRVPLGPIEQLEKNIGDYESKMRDFARERMRSSGSGLDHREARRLLKDATEYEIIREVGFDEVIEQMKGEEGRIVNDRIDESGGIESSDPFPEGHDLGEYLEYFFLDDEVESAYEIQISVGDFMSWDKSFYLAGYSDCNDRVDFGPADVFQGPELKYAQANIVTEDEEQKTLFPRSSVMSMQIHPGYQIEVYAEEEDVENYEEILR